MRRPTNLQLRRIRLGDWLRRWWRGLALLVGAASMFGAIVVGPIAWTAPETARLIRETRHQHYDGGSRVWFVETENGMTSDVRPHRSSIFRPGHEICIQRAKIEWLGIQRVGLSRWLRARLRTVCQARGPHLTSCRHRSTLPLMFIRGYYSELIGLCLFLVGQCSFWNVSIRSRSSAQRCRMVFIAGLQKSSPKGGAELASTGHPSP